MKKISLILLFILSTRLILAECAYYFQVFPQKKEISPNSWFMIECNFDLQNIIDSLNIKYTVYLRDENTKQEIELVIQEKLKGQDEISQVILKPAETLKLNHIYSIHIDSLDTKQYEKVVYKNSKTGLREHKFWTVVKTEDMTKPKFIKEPLLIAKETYSFGNGNSEYAIFDFETEDDNEVLIKTELVNMDSNQLFIFYLYVGKEDKLLVGKNM